MAMLDVDAARGTYAHHCRRCGSTRRGLRLKTDIEVDTSHGSGPGQAALTVACPCGARECFNTGLTGADEVEGAHNPAWRAGQARLIRAAMRHPHVGLAEHVAP